MRFVGIDLAWTRENETGFAVLEGKNCLYLAAEPFSDEQLLRLVDENRPCIVSVDAPLVVKNETGGRSVDSLLMKTRIHGKYLKLYATSRSYMQKHFRALRGEVLRLGLEDRGFRLGTDLVETFPTGIFLSLFPDLFDDRYKISSRLKLERLKANADSLIAGIGALGFRFNLDPSEIERRKDYKTFEDKLDGLLCGLNSYCFYHGRGRVWSDDSGLIVLPDTSSESDA